MKTNSNLNLSTYRKPNGVRTSGATSLLTRRTAKNAFLAQRKRCFDNVRSNHFIHTKHFNCSCSFWKISGDFLKVDNEIACGDSIEQLSVKIRFSESFLNPLPYFLVTAREPVAM